MTHLRLAFMPFPSRALNMSFNEETNVRHKNCKLKLHNVEATTERKGILLFCLKFRVFHSFLLFLCTSLTINKVPAKRHTSVYKVLYST